MRDRWRGLTSSSPAAIIHALHWASWASPYLRSCPSLSFPPRKKKQANIFCFVGWEKKTKNTPYNIGINIISPNQPAPGAHVFESSFIVNAHTPGFPVCLSNFRLSPMSATSFQARAFGLSPI